MIIRLHILLVVVCSLLFSCTEAAKQPPVQPQSDVALALPLQLPATFKGNIPCPDCLRVDITLNLRPDFIYQLRKTYQTKQGPGKIEAQMNRWRYSPDGRMIVLGKEKGLLKTYVITSEDRLQFLELESEDAGSQIDYELVRNPEGDQFVDSVKMRGMFRFVDDSALLTECASGKSFSVSQGGDYQTTLQAYLNTPHKHGESVLVSVTGKLVGHTPGSSQKREDIIIIDNFKRFYPNQDCEGNQVRANLTNTHWRLTEIDGKKIIAADPKQAPYLTLGSDKKLSGFGGCNRLMGSYLVKGEIFLVKRVASTRMACFAGIETESLFLQALDETETYRSEGEFLHLLDQNDRIRATFQAGP